MNKQKLSVGREDTDILLPHKGISRHHLTIELIADNRVKISDNQSSNGTFVIQSNRKVAVKQAEIAMDDLLIIADYYTTPKELFGQLDNFSRSKQEKVSSSSSNSPFSRYIRSDGGAYKEK